MKKIVNLLAFFMLVSVNFNVVLAVDNFKLHPYFDADSEASLLVTSGTYGDEQTAQKAIYHNDVSSPWNFGTYEFATQKFFIYTASSASWQGSQWQTLSGNCPIVFDGYTFPSTSFSPVIFFIAPVSAIYKVNSNFQYKSTQGKATAGATLFQFKAKDGTEVVNMNFGKKYTDNTLLTSDFYVNLHAGDTITFNQTVTLWGDPFCQWTKLQVMGNDNGTAFTSIEANESGFYFDNYLQGTDLSYLNTKITTSETLIGSAVAGTTLGTYPANSIKLFQSAINAAKSFLLNQPNAKQAEINTQLATLSTAYNTFVNSYKSSVIVTENSSEFKVTSGLYLIRLKGTDLYLTAPTEKGTTSLNRTTYQTLRDANVQNCQKWSIQFNKNTEFTNPPRYSFVTGIDGSANWTEEDASLVGHLDEAGNLREKNTSETQVGDEGLYHNFTIYFDGTSYGLNDAGLNRPLNISAVVSGTAVTMNYSTTSPIQFLYEFIPAPNFPNAINQTELNNVKIYSIENGVKIITDKVITVSVYNLAGVQIKKSIVNSEETIDLAKGAYILKYSNTIQKVIVR